MKNENATAKKLTLEEIEAEWLDKQQDKYDITRAVEDTDRSNLMR